MKQRTVSTICGLLLSSLSFFPPPALLAQEREVLGWVEKVTLYPSKVTVDAKLDTGADTSSLNASDIVDISKEGKSWVRFSVTGRTGEKVIIERPIKRWAMIKRHDGRIQKREVVRLGVCVGSVYLETDVNLIDRSNFDYPMLIGRTFMAGSLIVDPAITFATEPNCARAPKDKETTEALAAPKLVP
jgi:hypothetical protein